MRIALVPGVLALLPEYASQTDPVADLRAACLDAVAWLGPEPTVLADAQGRRVAAALRAQSVTVTVRDQSDTSQLSPTAATVTVTLAHPGEPSYLVIANGSATRTEKAPGYFDPRAQAYDTAVEHALRTPDPAALRNLDADLVDELWAGTQQLPALADLLEGAGPAQVDYADAPFGVQYWVMRWTTG